MFTCETAPPVLKVTLDRISTNSVRDPESPMLTIDHQPKRY